ncbi:unnamed protein product, partial [Discosporangium mesarthrocarpum]
LRKLHPWTLCAVAASGLQFVPSVPRAIRVGNNVVDTSKVEAQAEAQLTTRYWNFLERVAEDAFAARSAAREAHALVVRATVDTNSYELPCRVAY